MNDISRLFYTLLHSQHNVSMLLCNSFDRRWQRSCARWYVYCRSAIMSVTRTHECIVDLSSTAVGMPSRVILTDFIGLDGPTAVPGTSPGIAVIGDKTYTAGGPAETTGSNVINSILTNGVVYNGKTHTYTTTDTRPYEDSFGIGYTDEGNGTIVYRGQTFSAGGSAIVSNGHTYSVLTNGGVIDGSTITKSFTTSTQTLTLESDILTASEISSGVFAMNTATLTAGGEAKTVLGQEVTAASSGLVVAEASSTTSGSRSSPTSGAERLVTGCWAGLAVCGLMFSML